MSSRGWLQGGGRSRVGGRPVWYGWLIFAGVMMGVRVGVSWGFEEGRETAHRFKVEAGSTANFQSSSSAEDLIC